MVAIFYKNEKYTYYYVFLDQQKLEASYDLIMSRNVYAVFRSRPPLFRTLGPALTVGATINAIQ